MTPRPHRRKNSQTGPRLDKRAAGFARRRGTIVVPVTPKTSIRLSFKASLQPCGDQTGCDKMRTALFHLGYE
jgi:hypothetical protein